jgi:hypothetical protein
VLQLDAGWRCFRTDVQIKKLSLLHRLYTTAANTLSNSVLKQATIEGTRWTTEVELCIQEFANAPLEEIANKETLKLCIAEAIKADGRRQWDRLENKCNPTTDIYRS